MAASTSRTGRKDSGDFGNHQPHQRGTSSVDCAGDHTGKLDKSLRSLTGMAKPTRSIPQPGYLSAAILKLHIRELDDTEMWNEVRVSYISYPI
jgi:hypothetical protein